MLDYLINKGMKIKIDANEFRVPAGKKVNLTKWPTQVKPVYKSKKKYSKLLRRQVEELSALQRLHYASNRYALLLIFRAMDAAGKDGAIRHVMSGVDPQGCQVCPTHGYVHCRVLLFCARHPISWSDTHVFTRVYPPRPCALAHRRGGATRLILTHC